MTCNVKWHENMSSQWELKSKFIFNFILVRLCKKKHQSNSLIISVPLRPDCSPRILKKKKIKVAIIIFYEGNSLSLAFKGIHDVGGLEESKIYYADPSNRVMWGFFSFFFFCFWNHNFCQGPNKPYVSIAPLRQSELGLKWLTPLQLEQVENYSMEQFSNQRVALANFLA